MSDHTSLEDFVLSTVPPMAEYTLPYMAGVIGVLSPRRGQHLGSGFRCILNGQRCFVTAQHVIYAATQRFERFTISCGYGEQPYVFSGRIRLDPDFDIAICFLPDDYPENEKVLFWPEDRFDLNPDNRPKDYLFTHGYPGIQSKFVEPVMGVSSKSLAYGAMEQVEGLPPTAQKFHFALNYGPEGMQSIDRERIDLIDPHGMSGSFVLRNGALESGTAQWDPDRSLIVGVLVEHHQEEEVLLATCVTKLFELMDWDGSSPQ